MGSQPGKEIDISKIQSSFTVEQVKKFVEVWKILGFKDKQLTRADWKIMVAQLKVQYPNEAFSDDEFSATLFDLFDTDKSGKLDFEEVVKGVSVVCKGDLKDKAALVFDSFDLNKDNVLNRDEMKKALDTCVSTGQSFFETQIKAVLASKAKSTGIKDDIAIWMVNKTFTLSYWANVSPLEPAFQEEIFKIDSSNSGKITKQQWVAACDSNPTLKYFLQFNLGDFLHQRNAVIEQFVAAFGDKTKQAEIGELLSQIALIDSPISPTLKKEDPKK